MIEITTDFHKVLPLFQDLSKYNYIIYSILDRTLESRVFMDQLPNPTVVMAWDHTDDSGLYLEGKYTPEIAQKINVVLTKDIFPAANRMGGAKDITCCFAPYDEWNDHMESEIFKNIYVRRDTRKFFTYFHSKNILYDWRTDFPAKFSLVHYDGKTKEGQTIEGNPVDLTKFENFEDLAEVLVFAQDPFACCIVNLDEKKIITRVFTDWTSTHFLEMGINTDENFRKLGLGARCAAAMVEFAIQRGYTQMGWHCWAENIGSEKTALRAGFITERTHPVFHAWYNRFDNLLLHLDYLVDTKSPQSYEIYQEIDKEIRKNTLVFQKSFFGTQPYYQRWYLYLKIVINANANHFTEAADGLRERLNYEIDDPADFVQNLKNMIPTPDIWNNDEWKTLIQDLLTKKAPN